ncbi:hypothetical protein GCM10023097_74790 [Streptomyces collinus]
MRGLVLGRDRLDLVAEDLHRHTRDGPGNGHRQRRHAGRGQTDAATGLKLGGDEREARVPALRDDLSPVVDQHPAPVSGQAPGLHDGLPGRQAPDRLDRMDVNRVQVSVPHGAIVPAGTGNPRRSAQYPRYCWLLYGS